MKTKKRNKRKNTLFECKFYLYVRELINYCFILKTIRKQKRTNQWNALNLRSDWVGRIYTVVNIRKEDVGEEDVVKRARVFELMKPINNYIKSLDLHEIVFPAIEQQSEQSYLIVYSPLFRTVTFRRTLKYLIFLGILIYVLVKFPMIVEYIKNLFI